MTRCCCKDCGGRISARTTTGLCRLCSNRTKLRVINPLVAHRGGIARAHKAGQLVFEDVSDTDRLASAYKAGESASRLADLWGVSSETILRWLRRMGVPIRDRGRARDWWRN